MMKTYLGIVVYGFINGELDGFENAGQAWGADQIKAFRRLFNANARPVQPLNGRIVKESL